MRILGVDPSSRTIGLALLDGEQLLWAMSATLKGNLPERLLGASGVVRQAIEKEWPNVVVLETPGPWTRGSPRSSTHTIEVLAMVRGSIGAAMSAANVPCYEMTVNRARHLVLSKGNPKRHVIMDTLKLMGYEPPDEHAADALVVALAWQRERAFEERVVP